MRLRLLLSQVVQLSVYRNQRAFIHYIRYVEGQDALIQLFRYYGQLEKIIKTKRLNENGSIMLQHLFGVLQSKHFLEKIPLLVNSNFSLDNIQILKSSVILYKQNRITLSQLRDYVHIFELFQKNSKIEFRLQVINSMLKLSGRILCQEVFEFWVANCSRFLQSQQFLKLSEFLYLVINSQSINQVHERFKACKNFSQFNVTLTETILEQNLQRFLSYEIKDKRLIYVGNIYKNKPRQQNTDLKQIINNISTKQSLAHKTYDNFALLNGKHIKQLIEQQIRNESALIIPLQPAPIIEVAKCQKITNSVHNLKRNGQIFKSNFKISQFVRKQLQHLIDSKVSVQHG